MIVNFLFGLVLGLALAGKPTIDLGELEVLGDLKNPMVFQIDAHALEEARASVIRDWAGAFEKSLIDDLRTQEQTP